MDPLNAQLKETADALADLQSRYHTLEEDYGRTSASLDQAIADVSALQTRNDQLESVLNGIVSSKGWAWLTRFRYIKSRLKIGGSD
jgi:chromosome segregation ATPase